MEKNNETNQEALSNSKKKRLERQKSNESAKKKKVASRVVGTVVVVAVVACLVYFIGNAIYHAVTDIKPSSDYSAQLEDNGFIKGVTATDYITLADYKNIQVPLSEVEYPDSSVDADIQSALESHQVLVTEDVEVKDGDTVNIDYVGSIDGVEFDGGNSNEEGYDLEIGSGSFIDDFEQQLIGAKPGDVVTVEVTFPDDYSTEDLAGQDAEFVVDVHGVYVTPEYDDDFVAAYYSAYATTADEYRQYLKDTNYEDSLRSYVNTYLIDNSTVNKYPSKFLKNTEETAYYDAQLSYEYMNEVYMQYYGQGYGSFEEYNGMSTEEYLASLEETGQEIVKGYLVYQAILESEGVTLTEDDLRAQIEESYGSEETTYDSLVEQYGKGYLMLSLIEERAIEIAINNATVE